MDKPDKSHDTSFSATGRKDIFMRMYQDSQEKQKLLEKYNNFTEEHVKPLCDTFSKYSRSKPFSQYLDKTLKESKAAQKNLKSLLPSTDTTTDLDACIAELTRPLENLKRRLLLVTEYRITEFEQSILHLREEATSLSFVNMSQFTESLHENQQAYNQTTQQIKDYLSGNTEVDVKKALQKINQINDEIKVKKAFLDSHLLSQVKGINDKIDTISKELNKLRSYFVEAGQTGFVERLDAIREKQFVANANFREYFLENYAETMKKISAQRLWSLLQTHLFHLNQGYPRTHSPWTVGASRVKALIFAPEPIDDASVGTSQPPEGDAGEGPSKPEKKSQVKDENLSPELIQQIVVAPTKEQLDSTLPQLQQVCDAYKALKQEWAPLLNQLHKQREEAEMFIGAWFKLQQKRDALQPVLTEANSFLKQIQDPKASPIANELTYHSQLSSDVTALEGSLKQAEKAIEDSLNVLKRAKNINSILEQSENLALLDSEISETKRRLQIFEAQLIVRDIERTYKQARDLWEKMAPHPPRGRQRSFETSPFEKENPELKKSINGIRKIYIDISLSDNALLEELNVREDHEHICETLEKLKISMTRSELAKFREYYLSLPDKAGELDLKGADFTNILGKDAVGIIQTSVTMLDAQVLALSKKPDIYRKRLYDGLLLRALRFGQQQAHQIWKYATMDRERLIQAGLEQPSEQLGSGSSEEDVTVKDYSEYMNFLDNIATSVKIDISTKSLLERITSLYNRNKMAKQNILSPLEQSHPDIQATLEDSSPFSEHDNHALTDHEEQRQLHHILDSSINESHPAKEDYNKLVETTNDDFGRIISLLDKGYDDRWKSNQHIREEMKLIQQDSDATKTLIDKNNKDNNISAKINDITIRITKLVKFADSWMEAARSVYEFKAVYDEANSWSSDKDNFDKDDYDKIEGFLDNYEDLYNRAKANKDDPFDIAKKTVEHNTSIQETKEILLDLKRQQVRSYFDTVLEVLRFSDKQILEGDWTLQSHSSVARELKTEFMRSIQEDLIRIHDTCLNKDSIPKADFTVLDKAINELSELSKKVNNLGSEKDKLSSRIKKKIFEDRQYAAKLLERLESLEKTQKEILKSGALPSTTDLLNLPANKVLRIFGLGRVQRLTDGRLKNCVFREPAHLVKLIETTEFVLKALAAGEEPSAKFIKNIARQCMENIPVWQNDFTRWIRDEGMWGYRGRGSVGFNLTDTKWSEEGYKELCAKFDCRTGGSKIDNRYPNGHPVGDLCDKDPRIMKREKQYFSRLLQDKDAPKFTQIIIDKLNEEIKASGNDKDKKLDAIVHCCQDLFQAHLLRDGNTRIIAGFILNFLLLKHGLRPAIIENPKIFAFFSFEEAKQSVIKGQEAFSKLMKSVVAQPHPASGD